MWTKTKYHINPVDSNIVTRDFIVAEGYCLHTFLDRGNFGRDLRVPVFYTFKVHKKHPMRIFSSNINHINIYPANELEKKKPRMPAEVFEDKMDYDLTTLRIVPFANPLSDPNKYRREFLIKDCFVSEIDDQVKDASLLYLNHGTSINSGDSLYRISEVMPSQLVNHIFHWLIDIKKITSHDETFNQNLEGKIEVPLERARTLTAELICVLENRYDTRLTFEDYREDFPAFWNG